MRCIEFASLARIFFMLAALASLSACAGIAQFAQTSRDSGAAKARAQLEISAQSRVAYERAVSLLKAQRYTEAEQQLIELVAREPQIAGPHANLGILYRRLGKNTEAIRALEHAIDLNPRAAYYNELGMVHRADGRFDRAKWAYERALALEPDYAYAHLNIGILCDLYLQEPDKALTHYERYRALAPDEAATVAKWITDLKRRTNRTAEQSPGGKSG